MIARPVFAEHLLTTTSSSSELIFVTDITVYICGEKIVQNLNSLWSFIEVDAVFVPNLYAENLCGEKMINMRSESTQCNFGTEDLLYFVVLLHKNFVH